MSGWNPLILSSDGSKFKYRVGPTSDTHGYRGNPIDISEFFEEYIDKYSNLVYYARDNESLKQYIQKRLAKKGLSGLPIKTAGQQIGHDAAQSLKNNVHYKTLIQYPYIISLKQNGVYISLVNTSSEPQFDHILILPRGWQPRPNVYQYMKYQLIQNDYATKVFKIIFTNPPDGNWNEDSFNLILRSREGIEIEGDVSIIPFPRVTENSNAEPSTIRLRGSYNAILYSSNNSFWLVRSTVALSRVFEKRSSYLHENQVDDQEKEQTQKLQTKESGHLVLSYVGSASLNPNGFKSETDDILPSSAEALIKEFLYKPLLISHVQSEAVSFGKTTYTLNYDYTCPTQNDNSTKYAYLWLLPHQYINQHIEGTVISGYRTPEGIIQLYRFSLTVVDSKYRLSLTWHPGFDPDDLPELGSFCNTASFNNYSHLQNHLHNSLRELIKIFGVDTLYDHSNTASPYEDGKMVANLARFLYTYEKLAKEIPDIQKTTCSIYLKTGSPKNNPQAYTFGFNQIRQTLKWLLVTYLRAWGFQIENSRPDASLNEPANIIYTIRRYFDANTPFPGTTFLDRNRLYEYIEESIFGSNDLSSAEPHVRRNDEFGYDRQFQFISTRNTLESWIDPNVEPDPFALTENGLEIYGYWLDALAFYVKLFPEFLLKNEYRILELLYSGLTDSDHIELVTQTDKNWFVPFRYKDWYLGSSQTSLVKDRRTGEIVNFYWAAYQLAQLIPNLNINMYYHAFASELITAKLYRFIPDGKVGDDQYQSFTQKFTLPYSSTSPNAEIFQSYSYISTLYPEPIPPLHLDHDNRFHLPALIPPEYISSVPFRKSHETALPSQEDWLSILPIIEISPLALLPINRRYPLTSKLLSRNYTQNYGEQIHPMVRSPIQNPRFNRLVQQLYMRPHLSDSYTQSLSYIQDLFDDLHQMRLEFSVKSMQEDIQDIQESIETSEDTLENVQAVSEDTLGSVQAVSEDVSEEIDVSENIQNNISHKNYMDTQESAPNNMDSPDHMTNVHDLLRPSIFQEAVIPILSEEPMVRTNHEVQSNTEVHSQSTYSREEEICAKLDCILQILQGSSQCPPAIHDNVLSCLDALKSQVKETGNKTLFSLSNLGQVEARLNDLYSKILSLQSHMGLDNTTTIFQHLKQIRNNLGTLEGQETILLALNELKTRLEKVECADLDPVMTSLHQLRSQIGQFNDDTCIVSCLKQIQQTLGSSSQESIHKQLNTLASNLTQIQEQLPDLRCNFDVNRSDFQDTLRDILLPNVSQTLTQISNTLIHLVREELRALILKYNDIKKCLLDLRDHLNEMTPPKSSESQSLLDLNVKEAHINNDIQSLLTQIGEYCNGMVQLHAAVKDLIGQANDNTKLLANMNQRIDPLDTCIQQCKRLLELTLNENKDDVQELIKENKRLRLQMKQLIEHVQNKRVWEEY